jgi:hypothetical protein
MARRGEKMRGVFFGNPFRDQPPSQRGDSWPPNVLKFATERGLALITTHQLFEVMLRVEGK